VLINLVANAAQALQRARTPGGRVTVCATTSGAMLTLSVTDNGPGMPREILQRVGTPFFSTRAEGTGLGVAQCRRLVGRAGGSFQIESAEGQGTVVTLSLPIVEATAGR
jgi:signal transduction histidine kinase